MGKNFLGLDGLKHFWSKAKTWIIDRITTEVTAKIAEIVANAPKDLDTLKEIADWISTHEDSASAMNTAILANTEAISGKADKSHTHTKSQITDFPTSLPANGGTATKATQDGSGNVITSTYVKKSGDTLTGPIVMKANQYTLETAQLDMKNSDIKGANAIWFDDHAEVGEGLKFPRSSGSNYDFMRLDDGKIKVAPNVTGNANTATESIVAYTSDIPTSLPANGGTADSANVPTGFEKIGNQDRWGNQDGVFITDWQTPTKEYGNGDISFRYNKGQLNVIIDGVFYQNEGKYKLVDENSLKDIMKPNYTTGRLPAGVYKAGQSVSVSASITTTRGNPVFISYSGDFNSVNHGSTVPWIAFELFVDDQIVQRTSIDDSVALESDNTPFAGNALAVLSAGSHIIRLSASFIGNASGQIQLQEQDNIVNLVAFEL